MAGPVIDDVLGIVMLAIGTWLFAAASVTGGVDWVGIAVIAGKAVGIWVSASIIGLIMSRKISTLLKCFGTRASIAVMALGFALILSALFEEAGLAMIISACPISFPAFPSGCSRAWPSNQQKKLSITIGAVLKRTTPAC